MLWNKTQHDKMIVQMANIMAAKPQCRGKVEKREGTWFLLTVELWYLVVARIIIDSFLPQVENKTFLIGIRSDGRATMSRSSWYTQPLSLPPLFRWYCCWFPDLDDRMTRSAGRWSPFAALTTSPTATWYYQPHTSRGQERGGVAVVRTGAERGRRGWEKEKKKGEGWTG